MSYEPVKILIVDDDDVCIMALQRVMKKMKLVNPVTVAHDGVEALEILKGEKDNAKLCPPYIILLDINMPRMGGHEFLERIRDDEMLCCSLVFVLTTSNAREDVERAYDHNVAGYVLKESPYDSFVKTFEMVDQYSKLIVFPT
ncbi:MAG: response regulator [Paracoccaceae bacterium]